MFGFEEVALEKHRRLMRRGEPGYEQAVARDRVRLDRIKARLDTLPRWQRQRVAERALALHLMRKRAPIEQRAAVIDDHNGTS